jgi:hypothetical protein
MNQIISGTFKVSEDIENGLEKIEFSKLNEEKFHMSKIKNVTKSCVALALFSASAFVIAATPAEEVPAPSPGKDCATAQQVKVQEKWSDVFVGAVTSMCERFPQLKVCLKKTETDTITKTFSDVPCEGVTASK